MSLVLSIGPWGGFYTHRSTLSWRLCLGFVAVTVLFKDVDFVWAAGLSALTQSAKDEPMSRIIINNQSSHDDYHVLMATVAIIANGRISDNGNCYCYCTTFESGLAISARRTKQGTDTFTAFDR